LNFFNYLQYIYLDLFNSCYMTFVKIGLQLKNSGAFKNLSFGPNGGSDCSTNEISLSSLMCRIEGVQ